MSREESLQRLLKKINKGSRAQNVLILGQYGSGKSTFINTVCASLSGEWEPHAYAGQSGGEGRQTTFHIRMIDTGRCMSGWWRKKLPTLIDTQGFEDNPQEIHRTLLEWLLNGYFSDGESIKKAADVYKDFEKAGLSGEKGLQAKYGFFKRRKVRIDRVVFVASALSRLPQNLMELIRNTTNSPNRAIPLYGVLTHMDKVNERSDAFLRTRREFQNKLGLTDDRYLQCTNYCDDFYFEGHSRHQTCLDIDIPVIEFMTQVCNPAAIAIHHEITRRYNPCFKAGFVMLIIFSLIVLSIYFAKPDDFTHIDIFYCFYSIVIRQTIKTEEEKDNK
ncbi:uncharacterized protein LOC133171561 [Saccostrea echinata]|uniref:uncharacterized protein LOC133171561 n=1 Tax=Saccostrea echinata TaxID=191078 RepID=UPI002A7FFE19|nr:uncharacterized protein LOC133171561 [Saccostrea echinata]